MRTIYYNGTSHGEWEDKELPQLATHLGVTVEELNISSQAEDVKKKTKQGIERRVDREVGNQRKITGIVADCSLLSVVSCAVLLATLPENQFDRVQVMLDGILGEDATQKMVALAGKFERGEIVAPTQIKGMDSVLIDAEACASSMTNILRDIIPNKERQDDNKPLQR